MIDPDYARWILSAVAQSFAALTALTGVFGIYRMQVASSRRADVNRDAQRAVDNAIRHGFFMGSEIDKKRVLYRGLRRWVPEVIEIARQFAQQQISRMSTNDGSFHDTNSLPVILETALEADNRLKAILGETRKLVGSSMVIDGAITAASLVAMLPMVGRLTWWHLAVVMIVVASAVFGLAYTVRNCLLILRQAT